MQNAEQHMQKDTLAENIFTECNEDFILPDYMPEIRRVLRLESRLIQGEPFVGNGKADFEGSILYTLFYTDENEKLTAIPLESHYEYHLPLSAEVPHAIYAQETAESIHMRPSGPRRINIRAKIRAAVHALTEIPIQRSAESLLPQGCGETEFLVKDKAILRSIFSKGPITEAIAECTVDGVENGSFRTLYGGADVFCESAHAQEGCILCRGKIAIKLLFEKNESEIIGIVKHVPFEEEIPAEGCTPAHTVTAYGVCHSVELGSEEDENGVSVTSTARFHLEATARKNEYIHAVTDMYATETELIVTAKPLASEQLIGGYMGSFSATGESAAEENESIPLCSAAVRSCTVDLFDTRAVLSGEIRADLLCYRQENEHERFYASDMIFPFRFEAELGSKTDPADKISYMLLPVCAEAAVQNGKRHVALELALCLTVTRGEETYLPDAVTTKEKAGANSKESVLIYYPTEKDSLWSIGKKYGIPTEILQKQNGILRKEDTALDSTESLDGIAWVFASVL